jgi:hypothetical protein
MSDEAAAPAPVATEAPAATPKPPANESIADGLRRLGGGNEVFKHPTDKDAALAAELEERAAAKVETSTETDDEPEVEASEDKGKRPKAKRTEAKPDAAPAGEVEQLRALATKLGMSLEDGKVTTTERVKLREEKRANLQAISQARQNAIAEVQKMREEIAPRITRAQAFEEAVASGDFNAIAQHAGFKDWNEMQEDQLKKAADPNYRKLLDLESQLKAEKAEKEKAREQAEQQERTHAQIRAQNQYKSQLSARMVSSQDPLVKAMADMPNFVNAVFNVQNATWDGSSDAMTPEHAIRHSVNGAPSLLNEMKTLYERLAPVFAPKAAPAPAAPAKKPAAKPVAAATPPVAPAVRNGKREDEAAYWDDFRARMAAATEEERRNERRA